MVYLFFFLGFASFVLLIWGLIAPRHFKRSRQTLALVFGGLWFLFTLLMVVTAPPAANVATKTSPTPSVTPKNTPKSTPTPRTETTPKPSQQAAPVLTGFGATIQEWNKTHTAAKDFTSDSAYNPEPNSAGGCNGVEYCSMQGTTYYEMSWPNGQSQAVSQAIVMKEFPADTTIVWQQKMTADAPNACYDLEVHSATLAQAQGTDGDATVEFQTFDPNNSTGNIEYDPSNVNQAILDNIDAKTPTAANGC